MRQFILPLIIVSLWVVFIPFVAATHSITVSDMNGNSVGTQSNPLSTCPKPLTPQDLLIKVKNTGTITDTYSVDVDLPAGWELGLIRSDFSLGAGQTGEINPFLISYIPSNTKPGVYKIDIIVKSSNNPTDTMVKSVYIDILSCHSVDIEVVDNVKSTCKENPGETVYNMKVKNNGKYSETFDIVSSEGWASPSMNKITIGVGETKSFDVTLSPPSGLSGSQNVIVTIKSKTTYAENSKTLTLNLEPCYAVSAILNPTSKQACLGDSATFDLTVKNLGKADSFIITTPDWIDSSLKNLQLGDGEQKTFSLTANPTELGSAAFDVSIDSDFSVTEVVGTVSTEECRDVTVFLFPDDKTACMGDVVEYTITIKNTGKKGDTFDITTTYGTPEVSSVEVGAGQTKSIDYIFDTEGLTGNLIVGVKAKSSNSEIFDQASSKLVLEECYSASVDIVEEQQDVCPFFDTSFTVLVKNTGKMVDSYNLKVDKHTEIFSLNPGETKNIDVPILANVDSGEFTITAELASNHVTLTDTANLRVKTSNECFSSEVVRASNGAIVVEEQKGVVVPIKIRNVGDQGNSYDVNSDGPEWTFLRPTTVDLGPKDENNVYLYLLPPLGTPSGEYEIIITAESLQTSSSMNMMVEVISGTPPEEQPEVPEQPAGELNIVETAINAGMFNTLVEAIGIAGLTETLEGQGPFTVFAPTDEAFNNLPEGALNNLLQDPEQLAYILKYHVVKADLTADEVAGVDGIETLDKTIINVDSTANGVKLNGNVNIIQTDIMATNGIIHVIDAVLIPGEVTETPEEDIVLVVNESEDSDTITLNSSLGGENGITGELTSDADTPFWKTAVVGIITIIIIAILIVRFALLVKGGKKAEEKESKDKKNSDKKKDEKKK